MLTPRLDARGRAWVTLGKGHPYANSGGWQWLGRLRMMERLGHRLPPGIHVHHLDGDRTNDDRQNLVTIAASDHGKLHGARARRDSRGRFRPARYRRAPLRAGAGSESPRAGDSAACSR